MILPIYGQAKKADDEYQGGDRESVFSGQAPHAGVRYDPDEGRSRTRAGGERQEHVHGAAGDQAASIQPPKVTSDDAEEETPITTASTVARKPISSEYCGPDDDPGQACSRAGHRLDAQRGARGLIPPQGPRWGG